MKRQRGLRYTLMLTLDDGVRELAFTFDDVFEESYKIQIADTNDNER